MLSVNDDNVLLTAICCVPSELVTFIKSNPDLPPIKRVLLETEKLVPVVGAILKEACSLSA